MATSAWSGAAIVGWHPAIAAAVGTVAAGCWLAGRDRGTNRSRPVGAPPVSRATAALVVAAVAVYTATGSPLDGLAAGSLFSATVLSQVLLSMVAAPLLPVAVPVRAWRAALRLRPLRWTWARLSAPVPALILFNLVLSLVHVPGLVDYTVRHPALRFAQDALVLGSGVALWWPVCSPLPELPRLSPPMQLLYLFVNAIATTAAFAPITFAGIPLYSAYASALRPWGISPLLDQRLGGMIMHLGSTAAYGAAFALAFFSWIETERRAFPGPGGQVGAAPPGGARGSGGLR